MQTQAEDKLNSVVTALEDGIVMLHIDSRCDGVDVPPQVRGDARLLLSIAWGFKLPALDIDEKGIYAVLRFGTQDYGCTVPWPALYAITQPEFEQRGVLWPGSMPAEAIAAAPQLSGLKRVVLGPPAVEKPAHTGPRLVPDPGDDEDETPEIEVELDIAEESQATEEPAPVPSRPSLALAPAPPDVEDADDADEPDPDPPAPLGRTHLRVVK